MLFGSDRLDIVWAVFKLFNSWILLWTCRFFLYFLSIVLLNFVNYTLLKQPICKRLRITWLHFYCSFFFNSSTVFPPSSVPSCCPLSQIHPPFCPSQRYQPNTALYTIIRPGTYYHIKAGWGNPVGGKRVPQVGKRGSSPPPHIRNTIRTSNYSLQDSLSSASVWLWNPASFVSCWMESLVSLMRVVLGFGPEHSAGRASCKVLWLVS